MLPNLPPAPHPPEWMTADPSRWRSAQSPAQSPAQDLAHDLDQLLRISGMRDGGNSSNC